MDSILQIAILGAVFLGVFGLAVWGAQRLQVTLQVQRRLKDGTDRPMMAHGHTSVVKNNDVQNPVLAWVQAATATKPEEQEAMKVTLAQAGYESPTAPVWFVIVRFTLAIGLPLTYIMLQTVMPRPATGFGLIFVSLVLCAVGFIAPRAFVDRAATNRKTAIQHEFPDALDLMVVCVEAGLGLESAFVRVGEEVAESHPRISEQFSILAQELRAGRTRAEALRALGDRTQVPAIRSFAALLIQTDALGTSIADTLRVYSREMREHRYLAAEEKAMRIPVLMTVPLVVCILPVIITALMLPAVITVIRQMVPAMNGGG